MEARVNYDCFAFNAAADRERIFTQAQVEFVYSGYFTFKCGGKYIYIQVPWEHFNNYNNVM